MLSCLFKLGGKLCFISVIMRVSTESISKSRLRNEKTSLILFSQKHNSQAASKVYTVRLVSSGWQEPHGHMLKSGADK